MKRKILACLALASCCFSLSAQQDTLRSRKGVIPVTVQSFKNNSVEVLRSMPSGQKTMSIPYSEMESVRFADGFEVRFQDGQLVRDNLLSAPKLSSRLWSVKAEDAIDLTQDEIRQYYGDRLYYQVFRPYRTLFFTGLGKIGVGAMGRYAMHRWGNPSVWMQGRISSSSTVVTGIDTYHTETQADYSYGDLYPGRMAVEDFFFCATLAGTLDCTASLIAMRHLRKRHETMTGPSLGRIKAEFWGGTALVATGLGAMGVFASRLNNHRQWYHYVKTVDGKVTQQTHEGEKASWNDYYGLLAGALVANLGISAIQLSQAQLSGCRKVDGTPYAMQINLGMSPSGYGLTMRF